MQAPAQPFIALDPARPTEDQSARRARSVFSCPLLAVSSLSTSATHERPGGRGGLRRVRKTPLPGAADAGFNAVRRAPQRLGTPGILLPKRQSGVESRTSLAVIVGDKSLGK